MFIAELAILGSPWVPYGMDIWLFLSFPSIYPAVASNL